MKRGTENKLKFKTLQRLMGQRAYQTKGILQSLWDFAAVNCPDGNIGRFTDDEIAVGVDWEGDGTELVTALVKTRWLDEVDVGDGVHLLVIHDWAEHCERNVHGSLAISGTYFWNGQKPKLGDLNPTARGNADRLWSAKPDPGPLTTAGARHTRATRAPAPEALALALALALPEPLPEPSLNQAIGFAAQTSVEQKLDDTVAQPPPVKSQDRSDEILAVFAHYRQRHPRAFAKPSADSREWKLIRARLQEGFTAEDLQRAIDGNHCSPHHCGQNEQQTKYHRLELIVRTGSHVQQFMDVPVDGTSPPVLSQRTQRTLQARDSVLRRYSKHGTERPS